MKPLYSLFNLLCTNGIRTRRRDLLALRLVGSPALRCSFLAFPFPSFSPFNPCFAAAWLSVLGGNFRYTYA